MLFYAKSKLIQSKLEDVESVADRVYFLLSKIPTKKF